MEVDLRKLKSSQLKQLAQELREELIDVVSETGGHLGAGLGVVELTVALHYVYNTPEDKIVWDVGHQAYGHKILTGRKKEFHTNRIYKGISGFPKISESEYDTFGVGHSSTSISAALGMAIASKYQGKNDRQHVAVIGDGGYQMTIQELGTIFQTQAAVKIVVLNNELSLIHISEPTRPY